MTASDWGRVDDAGTVWVRAGSSERAVGSYPGATPEEALAYFSRKFEELAGQVTLLEQRVRTTDLAPKEALAGVERLRESVAAASAVGDLGALAARIEGLVPTIEERRVAGEQARAKAREETRARKEALVAEAEQLAASTAWKVSGDRLRTLLEEWKAAPRLDRRSDDELWKRFSGARNAFDRNRRSHFAELDAQRDEAKAAKEKLVAEAETLADSTEWGATSAAYRDLMTRWKAAPRAGRGDEDRLWQRFRGAQDRFFAARSEVFASRDEEQRTNLVAKEALVAEAEALLPVQDLRAARAALRDIGERWEAVGHVPRDARPAVESRLRRVEDAVRAAEEGQWRRTNPEGLARAEATVAQLQSSIAKLGKELAAAQSRDDDRAVASAEAAIAARRSWLAEAEKALAEFS